MYVGSTPAIRLFASENGLGHAAKSESGSNMTVPSTLTGITFAPPRRSPVLSSGTPPRPLTSVSGVTVSIPNSPANG